MKWKSVCSEEDARMGQSELEAYLERLDRIGTEERRSEREKSGRNLTEERRFHEKSGKREIWKQVREFYVVRVCDYAQKWAILLLTCLSRLETALLWKCMVYFGEGTRWSEESHSFSPVQAVKESLECVSVELFFLLLPVLFCANLIPSLGSYVVGLLSWVVVAISVRGVLRGWQWSKVIKTWRQVKWFGDRRLQRLQRLWSITRGARLMAPPPIYSPFDTSMEELERIWWSGAEEKSIITRSLNRSHQTLCRVSGDNSVCYTVDDQQVVTMQDLRCSFESLLYDWPKTIQSISDVDRPYSSLSETFSSLFLAWLASHSHWHLCAAYEQELHSLELVFRTSQSMPQSINSNLNEERKVSNLEVGDLLRQNWWKTIQMTTSLRSELERLTFILSTWEDRLLSTGDSLLSSEDGEDVLEGQYQQLIEIQRQALSSLLRCSEDDTNSIMQECHSISGSPDELDNWLSSSYEALHLNTVQTHDWDQLLRQWGQLSLSLEKVRRLLNNTNFTPVVTEDGSEEESWVVLNDTPDESIVPVSLHDPRSARPLEVYDDGIIGDNELVPPKLLCELPSAATVDLFVGSTLSFAEIVSNSSDRELELDRKIEMRQHQLHMAALRRALPQRSARVLVGPSSESDLWEAEHDMPPVHETSSSSNFISQPVSVNTPLSEATLNVLSELRMALKVKPVVEDEFLDEGVVYE